MAVLKNAPGRSGAADDTRRRLVDVATELFATRGFEATSIRQIIAAAGVGNGAAVGYHFGSKENLQKAVLENALAPALEEYEDALAELEGLERAPTLRRVAEAYVGPVVRLRSSPRGRLSTRLLAQRVSEPAVADRGLGALDAVLGRFRNQFRRALSGPAQAELDWRLSAATGSLVAYVLDLIELPHAAEDDAIAALSGFIVGGLRAVPPRRRPIS